MMKEGVLFDKLPDSKVRCRVCSHRYENTYCPKCNALLIDRTGFRVGAVKIKDGKCPECGERISVVS